MTREEAVRQLENGGELVELAEAIGTVASDPGSSLDDIALGLRYRGFVREQAALALYRRTGRKLPRNRAQMMTDPGEWSQVLRGRQAEHPARRKAPKGRKVAPERGGRGRRQATG